LRVVESNFSEMMRCLQHSHSFSTACFSVSLSCVMHR